MAHNVSNEFKTALSQKSLIWRSYVKVMPDNVDITQSTFLQSWNLSNSVYDSSDGNIIGNAISKMLELQLISTSTLDLENKTLELYTGLVLNPNEQEEYWDIEYVPHGTFIVQPVENKELPMQTKFVAYDYMIKFNKKYIGSLTYPTTARDLVQDIANECGVILNSATFINEDFVISEGDAFASYTCREILSSIAKLSGSIAYINRSNELAFKTFDDSAIIETITKDKYFTFEKNNQWGGINELVLNSNDIEGENVTLNDVNDINLNGLTQVTIQEGLILYTQDLRTIAITDLWSALQGIAYTPVKFKSVGLPHLDPLDYINIYNIENNLYATYVLNHRLIYNYGSLKSEIDSPAMSKSEVELKYIPPQKMSTTRTEITVNKHEGLITSLVHEMYDVDGIVNENFTSIEQTVEDILFSIQNSGGSNLIKNSVLYAWENSLPKFWTIVSGSVDYVENDWSLATLAKRAWYVTTGVATQDISVEVGKQYTISAKVLKDDLLGSASIYVSNAGATLELYTDEMDIPDDNNYVLTFTANSNAIVIGVSVSGTQLYIGDLMLSLGDVKTQWQQANGEVYTSEVLFDENGITVKSNVYEGYTTINPSEFAGYYELNGTLTKVFTLNKDTTEVANLKIESPIGENAILEMPPIKVIALPNVGWDLIFID